MARSKKNKVKEDLIKRGYNRFNPSPFDNESVTDCYQKAFRDEAGNRKYFLTYRQWDFSRYADTNHPSMNMPSYEAETQLTTKKGGTIDITFLHLWEPKDAEEFLEKLFETGLFKKYDERYGDDT